MTSADGAHRRRARRAIYGPPVAALVGLILIAGGASGLVLHERADGGARTSDADRSRSASSSSRSETPPSNASDAGYALVDATGAIFFSDGERAAVRIPADTRAVAATQASGGGIVVATSRGDVRGWKTATVGSFRDALGTTPIVGIAASPAGGYWLADAKGGVHGIGVGTFGQLAPRPLRSPIVGIAAAPSGGYWLAARDGSVYAFHAPLYGTAATTKLPAPVVGIAATASGGYLLATSDGRVFPFHTPNHGSLAGVSLHAPIAGVLAAANGGYWLPAADGGGVIALGAPFHRPVEGRVSTARIVAIVAH